MKRYYISDIIGTGGFDDSIRPAVADLNVNWVGAIESGPDGLPIHPDCLVMVDTVNHAALKSDPRIDSLPDFPLDGKVSSINATTKSEMDAALTRRGFDMSGLNSSDGYRQVLDKIGKQRSAAFDIDTFDVN